MCTETQLQCKICRNQTGNRLFPVKENKVGFPEEFIYLECAKCGCLQITEIPEELDKYYDSRYYYSFEKRNEHEDFLKRFLRKQLFSYRLGHFNPLGKSVSIFAPESFSWIKKGQLTYDSAILDVGCGTGRLLIKMANSGFLKLKGIDPFLSQESVTYECGVRIEKKQINEVEETFDFIMLHHSFEHMPQPLEALQKIYALLHPKHYALVAIPVAACSAWRKYGVNWGHLDAPRHLFLHTPKSIQILCEIAGFEIKHIEYNSEIAQFTSSELCLRNIPLVHPRNIFSRKQIKYFSKETKRLNQIQDGDVACFYLYKN